MRAGGLIAGATGWCSSARWAACARLTVGILSYDGGVSFGLLADRDLEPPVSEAAAALDASVAELLA